MNTIKSQSVNVSKEGANLIFSHVVEYANGKNKILKHKENLAAFVKKAKGLERADFMKLTRVIVNAIGAGSEAKKAGEAKNTQYCTLADKAARVLSLEGVLYHAPKAVKGKESKASKQSKAKKAPAKKTVTKKAKKEKTVKVEALQLAEALQA